MSGTIIFRGDALTKEGLWQERFPGFEIVT
jgi:hypothetical protein